MRDECDLARGRKKKEESYEVGSGSLDHVFCFSSILPDDLSVSLVAALLVCVVITFIISSVQFVAE